MIDLHTHSTASDGTLTPRELIYEAHSKGITIIALTDHDTTEGLNEAVEAAKELKIQLIPGIELDIHYSPGTFHLLGLGIDHNYNPLQNLIQDYQIEREKRNRKILKNMHSIGISCTWKDIEKESQRGVIGRPHFARVLVKKGWAKDTKDAFDRFLGIGKPLYESRLGADLTTAVQTIHAAGGLCFIAHPLSLRLNWGPFRIKLDEWVKLGIDGIETWHSGMSYKDGRKFGAIAKEYNLLESGGSDFHSPQDLDRKLGKTCTEYRKIPDELAIPILQHMVKI